MSSAGSRKKGFFTSPYHPDLLSVVSGALSLEVKWSGLEDDVSSYPVPRSRMSAATPPFSHIPSWHSA